MINHLDSVVVDIEDPFIASRYVGFVSVAAVSVFELSIKDIFIEFAKKKNSVFGEYTSNHFKRINGRIKLDNIRNDYVKKFGNKYLTRFNTKLEHFENETLRLEGQSIKTAYSSLIEIRNSFAHAGIVANTVTYREIVIYYNIGKKMIKCLEETMVR